MSDLELDPVAPKAPEPEPAAAPPAPQRELGGALFDTGLGTGMGAPTLLRHLERRPPADRKAGIEDLNGRVGNRQVSRMILARDGYDDGAVPEAPTANIDLATASDAEKLEEIRKQLDDDAWYNSAGLAAYTIWDSFGERLPEVANANPDLWARQVEATPGIVGTIPSLQRFRDQFKADVETIVLDTLEGNRAFVMAEMEKLGLGGEGGGAADQPTKENDAAVAETQKALELASLAMKAKTQLRSIPVGRESDQSGEGGEGASSYDSAPVFFDPKEAPHYPAFDEPGFTNWEDVKAKWDLVQLFLMELMSRYPVVQAVISQHEGDRSGEEEIKKAGEASEGLSKMSPQEARQFMSLHLRGVLERIENAVPRVGGDLDYRDFEPVHARLMAGVGPSGTNWSQPFQKSIIEMDVRSHGIDKLLQSLTIGAVSAAAFILAEFATAGMATFLLVGAGLGLGAAQAAMSWEEYADLAAMHEASTRPELMLISREQVDSAAFAAVLDTVFVFLDVAGALGPLARASRASRGVMEAAEEGMKASAAVTLKEAIGGPGAAPAIKSAVDELGVHGAASAVGKTPEQLAKMVEGTDPALAQRILAAADLAKPGSKALEDIAKKLPNLAALKASGELAPDALEAVVRQAFDQFGMAGTIKRAGGWKTLTKTLGDGSAAAQAMDAWRKSLLEDLQKWVTKQSDAQAAATRTGNESVPSNDLDINMMEIEASGYKDRAKTYLAGRAGIGSDELPMVLDAAFMVDPTRMHLQDVAKHGISKEVREQLARGQAKFDEQLLYSRRVYDARQAGDAAGAERILAEARDRGINPIEFRPLSDGQRKALELQNDQLMRQLDSATDEATKKELIMRIHQQQAMINASTPDAYMMGGGVSLNVSRRDIDVLKMPEMAGGPGAADRYGAALDETIFLDEARRTMAHAGKAGFDNLAAKLADEVKNIGKHGERMAKQMQGKGATMETYKKLQSLANTFALLVADARAGKVAARTKTAKSLKALQAEMKGHLNTLEGIAQTRLKELRLEAGLGEAIPPELMEQMTDAIAFQASVAAAARKVDGYTMAIVEGLEGAVDSARSGGEPNMSAPLPEGPNQSVSAEEALAPLQ